MTKREVKERIEALKKEIDKYRYQYHVLNKLDISEAALDSLKHELKKLEDQHPDLITPDSPTQRVAGEALKGFKKVHRKNPMLSLEDVFSPEEFKDWLLRIQKLVPGKRLNFYCELKIDGFAVSLIYKKGFLETGATRGDGKIGEDVTQNLRTIEAIPLKLAIENELPEGINEKKVKEIFDKGEFEVRGEVFMTKKVFEKVNKEQSKRGLQMYANPRNTAAGSVRQLNPKITASRELSFLAYDLVTDVGQIKHSQEHELLAALGFKTDELAKECSSVEDVVSFWQHVQKIREKLPYHIDGVVVNVNDNRLFEQLGVVGKTPRGAVAFKFPAEQSTSVIKDIIVGVGRTGTLTPIAILDPVNIGGVIVKRASLHNMDEIERLGLKIGDTVIVERAGDVIPDVVSVLPKLRPHNAKVFHMPKNCPICGHAVSRDGVAYKCVNKNCPAIKREGLYHFVSRSAFNIVGLGPKILDRFYEEGFIKDAADIFKLKEEDIVQLERFGEKSAENIINSIRSRKKVPLERLIYSLGILHVGSETAHDLARHFKSIEKISKANLDDLRAVPNIGEIVAKSIHEWFNDVNNKKFLEKLLNVGVEIENPKISAGSEKLKGKSFVFTGELESMSREEAESKVRQLGGDPSGSVSKKTRYVVAGSNPGSKYEKAKKLGVKIIEEKDFLKLIK
ncbi:NAD-dependent DNA ligase LigA [Candidatus Parcubacteria bacterium]|nr:MAG: NAD-dependent DNA ligase LigA [Candidatus Parcubacteria bacterium]